MQEKENKKLTKIEVKERLEENIKDTEKQLVSIKQKIENLRIQEQQLTRKLENRRHALMNIKED